MSYTISPLGPTPQPTPDLPSPDKAAVDQEHVLAPAVAPAAAPAAPPAAAPGLVPPPGPVLEWSSNENNERPLTNLLRPKSLEVQPPTPTTPDPGSAPASSAKPPKPKGGHLPVSVVAIVVAVALAAVVYAALANSNRKPVTLASPTQTPRTTKKPSPTATPKPATTAKPTPNPTHAPSPTATPQLTVSAPAQTPTASHPQSVTITSKSGEWLRSSPSSASRSNIITWMPYGAQISVDSVGDFWWHGTYNGQPGYFASSYTQ
jgi:hypothetical protein